MPPEVLVLRPQPGALETAIKARALGLAPVVASIFEVRPLAWQAPAAADFDALLLTSANAPRHAGEALTSFAALPCYAVGEATAAAARAAGIEASWIGPSDGVATIARMVADGVRTALHLSGRDHVGLSHPSLTIDRRAVYGADPLAALPPQGIEALKRGALALIHSPRAGAQFAQRVDEAGLDRSTIALAAISEAASSAAGPGWKSKAAADRPRDEALLELAVKLCKGAAGGGSS